MYLKFVSSENTNYVTETEYHDAAIKDKIKEYKNKYKDVAVIINGNKPIEPVLRKMVELYC
jgi:hypothetical protein